MLHYNDILQITANHYYSHYQPLPLKRPATPIAVLIQRLKHSVQFERGQSDGRSRSPHTKSIPARRQAKAIGARTNENLKQKHSHILQIS